MNRDHEKRPLRALAVGLVIFVAPLFASAQEPIPAPLYVPFQGVLTGLAPSTTTLNLTVTLARSENGEPLREETHSNVTVIGGAFSVALGIGSATGVSLIDVFNGDEAWVQVIPELDSGETFTQQVFFAPMTAFAMHVAEADVAEELVGQEEPPVVTAPGIIMYFGGDIGQIPAGWAPCDGRRLDAGPITDENGDPQDSPYLALFNVIGYQWGLEDPNPNIFYVPDLRGVFLRGVLGSRSQASPLNLDVRWWERYASGGQATQYFNGEPETPEDRDTVGAFQADAFQSHLHTSTVYLADQVLKVDGAGTENNTDENGSNVEPNLYSAANMSFGFGLHDNSGLSARGSETRPKNAYVHYIIKL